jgi:hypothetical protein
MRFIKLAIISFVIIFLLITVVGLLFPSHVRISKAIDMEHSKPAVFSMIRDTSTWKNWNPVFMQGSKNYTASPANYHVRSENDSLLLMEVTYKGGDQVLNGWQIHQYNGSDRYTLQWYADFQLGWLPWERMGSLFFEKTYGSMMERGLHNLDSVLTLRNSDPLSH